MPTRTSCIETENHTRIINAFVTGLAGTAYVRTLFHAAGKFCENELKACGLTKMCTGTFLFLKKQYE